MNPLQKALIAKETHPLKIRLAIMHTAKP